ncbi:MAG: HAMP domain-containing histidine kinase [Magnetospirillum sp.]|nr:HAMP domain-containing histidine kinase [Magnetospirillum sp.]
MTRLLLADFTFDGRRFEALPAHSAAEAEALLALRPDIPVALLDVVMETPDAGLKLVRRIREEMGNRRIRIILRTGQPGEAPEREVVLAYDVNDYKSKTELTAQRLFTALVGAVRAWRDLVTIEALNDELASANASLERRVAKRTAELARAKDAAELALHRETEAKGQLRQFLSMVSHEFRTPLAIIDSAAQMLSMRASATDSTLMPRLGTIRGAVNRLIALIDTCLADEQLESGRIALQEQELNLAPVLRTVLDGFRTAAPGRSFVFEAPQMAPVWGDPAMLGMVFNNLIGNAVKYSPEGAPVEVGAAPDGGGGVAVSIRDHGIGIPAADLARVFERFFRASNVEGVAGSGIGLHMVRQIVDLHGGSLNIDSAVGEGTVVTVRLRTAPRRRRRT